MKNKSTRHKSNNIFKFQSFSERIASIDVDVFHKVKHPYEDEDEDSDLTYFYRCIEKWETLNCSEDYRKLVHSLPSDIHTLPQLLIQKEDIINTLIKHTTECDVSSLIPTLELISALARDLRKEFYPYFFRVLETCIYLLNTQDADQIESTFICLAYIFKYLFQYIVKHIKEVLQHLLPLLSDSQPPYINNFAAQSFAYVARKVKDKTTFMKQVLSILENRQDVLMGLSKLIFEVMKGVNNQFHSCSRDILHCLLHLLTDLTVKQDLLFQVLNNVNSQVTRYISRNTNFKELWALYLKTVEEYLARCENEQTIDNVDSLWRMLKLVHDVIYYKSYFVNDYEKLVQYLTRAITISHHDKLHEIICDLIFSIFSTEKCPEPQILGNFPQIFRQIVNGIVDEKLAIAFIERFLTNVTYKNEVYSVAISFSQRLFQKYAHVNDALLSFLTKLVLVPSYGSTGDDTIYFPLTAENGELNEMTNQLLKLIPVDASFILSDKIENIICSILILSRVRTTKEEFLSTISELLNSLGSCVQLNERDNSSGVAFKNDKYRQLLLICADIINRSTSVRPDNRLTDEVIEILLHIGLTYDDVYALNIFGRCKSIHDYPLDRLKSMICQLGNKLSSPYHKVRMIVAKILSDFNVINDIYANVHRAECIVTSINNYRDKLQLLQQLECDENLICAIKNEQDLINVVHFLIGNLYINFRLIWEPVQQLLISHARYNQQFFPVYKSYLYALADKSRSDVLRVNSSMFFSFEPLNEYFNEMYKMEDKPDLTNVRCLLWKTLSDMINLKCVNQTDVVDVFMNFISYECTLSNPGQGKFCNLKKISNLVIDDVVDNDDNDDDDYDTNEQDSGDYSNGLASTGDKSEQKIKNNKTRLLLAHLEVFTKINPSKMLISKKNELLNIYLDLLSHKHPTVQKFAMDCILVYKNNRIVPYKDHIYKMIDNKTFKDELVYFQIDESNSVVHSDHRAEILKIVMRILYGRLLRGAPNKKAGQHNRELIFRFLAGCKEDELMIFIKMGFQKFDHKLNDNAMELTTQVINGLDIENVIPLKQYLSALNMITVLFQQAGSLMGQSGLFYLLRIILAIAAEVLAMLKMKEHIHGGYLGILNKLRYRCYDTILYFYNNFENYVWRDDEINAVFEVFVWPFLKKLTVEGLHNPTVLTKLIICWGSNSKYFNLLEKYHSDGTSCLQVLMNLLQIKEISIAIRNIILDVMENLLFLNDDEPLDSGTKGSLLLLPYTSVILQYFQSRLEKEKNVLNRKELAILSEISKYVNNKDQGDLLITLLLPILAKKCTADEETVISLLRVIHNLIGIVTERSRYCRKIAPFFNSVSCLSGRKLLCEIVACIGNDCPGGQINPSIIRDLNAMDRKWIEQPDYAKRLEAINNIENSVNDSNISLDMGVLIVYNCFYMIRTEKDIALKDNSGMCLRKLCPSLCTLCRKRREHKSIILDDVLFPIIRDAIRGTNESLKYECVMLLGHLAKECAKLHPVLKDLSLLTDPDGEYDFFENIQHLQVYQKMKALHRFCDVMSKQVKYPQPRSLTQFVLPLVSQFLLSSQYANKNTLIDAAINALKIICLLLPWRQYEKILSSYLIKMRRSVEFQKQSVRIVSTVLDAFHYNIALACQQDDYNSLLLPRKEESNEQSSFERIDDDTTMLTVEDVTTDNNDVIVDANEQLRTDDNDDDGPDLIPAVRKHCIMIKSDADRISKAIRVGLLPYLNKCFIEYTESRKYHKVNKKKSTDDTEEIQLLTIPLAAAIAKLLYRLPAPTLEQNISGLFMKVCSYLKSRLQSVRMVARETMQNILLTIGAKYLPQLLSEMTSLLTKGFHVHVLVFTCHSILENTKHLFQKGDIDECLELVMELCMTDLFGELSQEKEVNKIVGKTLEARGNKSFNMLHILAEFVSENRLLDIIVRLKDILYSSLSRKTALKIGESLRHVTLGLVDNKFLPLESLLILSYGIVSESIPTLTAELKEEIVDEKEREYQSRRAPHSLILPEDPKTATNSRNVRVIAKTNAHVLVEFGLQVLQLILKRQMVKQAIYNSYLDPFVLLISKFIKSSYVKLNTLALQCLTWLFKRELPSLVDNIKDISATLFDILHRYATEGPIANDNAELAMVTFKAVSVLVREVKFHKISPEQLRALILYVEQGIYNYARSSTAFTLLKAILTRKYTCSELNSVMQKVFELSVQSEIDNVRLAARQAFYRYLIDYPVKKNLKLHLSSCVAQLQYEQQTGRDSILELLRIIVLTFPIDTLGEHCLLLFTPISITMVDDEALECRQKASQCLTIIIDRLKDTPQFNKLLNAIFTLMKSKKLQNRILAARILQLFVDVAKTELNAHLSTISALVCGQFNGRLLSEKPGRFLKLKLSDVTIDIDRFLLETNDENAGRDHFVFTILQLVISLIDNYPILLEHARYFDFAAVITEYSHRLLAHPHEWVRLSASQLMYRMLSALEPESIASAFNNKNDNKSKEIDRNIDCGILGVDVRDRIKTLASNLCDHLVPNETMSDKVITQAMKNLLYIAEVLKFVRFPKNPRIFSLPWLIRRIAKQVRIEITKFPQSTMVRSVVYNWFAALTTKLTSNELTMLLPYVLPSLVREITIETNNDTESTIRNMAKESLRYYRDKVPQQDYGRVLNEVRDVLQAKRIEKRVKLARQLVTDPERAAKRKIAKQLKNKENRKRKLEKLRGKKIKRRKTVDRYEDYDQ